MVAGRFRRTLPLSSVLFVWAKDMGYIEKLPLPKDVPLGKNAGNQ